MQEGTDLRLQFREKGGVYETEKGYLMHRGMMAGSSRRCPAECPSSRALGEDAAGDDGGDTGSNTGHRDSEKLGFDARS